MLKRLWPVVMAVTGFFAADPVFAAQAPPRSLLNPVQRFLVDHLEVSKLLVIVYGVFLGVLGLWYLLSLLTSKGAAAKKPAGTLKIKGKIQSSLPPLEEEEAEAPSPFAPPGPAPSAPPRKKPEPSPAPTGVPAGSGGEEEDKWRALLRDSTQAPQEFTLPSSGRAREPEPKGPEPKEEVPLSFGVTENSAPEPEVTGYSPSIEVPPAREVGSIDLGLDLGIGAGSKAGGSPREDAPPQRPREKAPEPPAGGIEIEQGGAVAEGKEEDPWKELIRQSLLEKGKGKPPGDKPDSDRVIDLDIGGGE
ncbi:MAG: hypothetical protein HYU64_21250 [Armatimonadetes bacterium]|nr:hypothetical protein [Armatimonadota bacterium]